MLGSGVIVYWPPVGRISTNVDPWPRAGRMSTPAPRVAFPVPAAFATTSPFWFLTSTRGVTPGRLWRRTTWAVGPGGAGIFAPAGVAPGTSAKRVRSQPLSSSGSSPHSSPAPIVNCGSALATSVATPAKNPPISLPSSRNAAPVSLAASATAVPSCRKPAPTAWTAGTTMARTSAELRRGADGARHDLPAGARDGAAHAGRRAPQRRAGVREDPADRSQRRSDVVEEFDPREARAQRGAARRAAEGPQHDRGPQRPGADGAEPLGLGVALLVQRGGGGAADGARPGERRGRGS